MDYIELQCIIESDQISIIREVLTHELSNIGYESFVDTDEGLLAYIAKKNFDEKALSSISVEAELNLGKILYKWQLIKDQNWNLEWEKNFPPVLIANKCYIRATFHQSNNDVPYEIIIEPKMSFGTGHHETTSLVIEQMLHLNFASKTVLDMGCGTGILSIMAAKLGAKTVDAIDIDDWAYKNTIENCTLNNINNVKAIIGDKYMIPKIQYEFIIANINRNILLQDISVYCEHLVKNGSLIMSGFYINDLPVIREAALSCGLHHTTSAERNNWVAALFHKK
jgi:ribosomal protein L11 methyltransferase